MHQSHIPTKPWNYQSERPSTISVVCVLQKSGNLVVVRYIENNMLCKMVFSSSVAVTVSCKLENS